MEQFRLLGALVNALAVILGGAVGLAIKRLMGKKPHARLDELSNGIFHGVGLCVLAIGITGTVKAAVNDQILSALKGSYVGSPATPLQTVTELAGEETLVVILSIVLGAVIGYLCRLDAGINRLGERIEQLAKRHSGSMAQGFVSASLLFCVGSMAIVGSLNSGLQCDHTMLYTKSMLDMISAIVLASTLGVGVLCSSVFIFVYQGGITLLAQWVEPYLSNDVVTCMSVVGSILIIGLGLNMLGLTKLKIMNYVPAVILPALLIPLADWIGSLI